ncbi:MAG: DUF7697 family protein [Sphingomonas sp.]
MTRPIGLDYPAVFAMGAALGADMELLAGALPGVENAILAGLSGEAAAEPADFEE